MKQFPFPRPRLVTALVLLAALALLCACRTTKPKKWYEVWKREDPAALLYPEEIILPEPPEVLPQSLDTSEALAPEDEIEEPMQSIPETPPLRIEPQGFISELKTVHFTYDSYLLGPETRALLEDNSQWILQHPGITIQVEGHCDQRGTYEYNIHLGQKRADAVREYLANLGIEPGVLKTMSYGEERPLDPEDNDAAWAKNRRVQFLIY
jgi:peptidoglycan-associated lipoprotein